MEREDESLGKKRRPGYISPELNIRLTVIAHMSALNSDSWLQTIGQVQFKVMEAGPNNNQPT